MNYAYRSRRFIVEHDQKPKINEKTKEWNRKTEKKNCEHAKSK